MHFNGFSALHVRHGESKGGRENVVALMKKRMCIGWKKGKKVDIFMEVKNHGSEKYSYYET